MATLSNGTVEDKDSGAGTATLRVTSDTAGETLYVAVRTSGAYGPTDQEVIKAGTGAVYAASATSVVGDQNTFSATGLPSTGILYCGFAQDGSAAVGGLIVNFNGPASLDAFGGVGSVARDRDNYVQLKDGTFALIPQQSGGGPDVLFHQGVWDADNKVFLDDPDTEGVISSGFMNNKLLWSDDFTNAVWTKTAIDSVTRHGTINDLTDRSLGAWHITSASGTGKIQQTVVQDATPAVWVWARTVTGTGTINLGRSNAYNTNPGVLDPTQKPLVTLTEEWKLCRLFSKSAWVTGTEDEGTHTLVDFNGGTLTEVLLFAPAEAVYTTSQPCILTTSAAGRDAATTSFFSIRDVAGFPGDIVQDFTFHTTWTHNGQDTNSQWTTVNYLFTLRDAVPGNAVYAYFAFNGNGTVFVNGRSQSLVNLQWTEGDTVELAVVKSTEGWACYVKINGSIVQTKTDTNVAAQAPLPSPLDTYYPCSTTGSSFTVVRGASFYPTPLSESEIEALPPHG